MKFEIKLPLSEIFYQFRGLSGEQEEILSSFMTERLGQKFFIRPEESLQENIDYLDEIGYIRKGNRSSYHKILPNGIIYLAEKGKTKIIDYIDLFLKESKESRIKEWKNDQIQDFLQRHDISTLEASLMFQFLQEKGFFDHFGLYTGVVPLDAYFSSKGWNFLKNPKPFVSYVRVDQQDFRDLFDDEIILNWLQSVNAGNEDFQIEYKENTPPDNKLRQNISCLANGDSGILGIGFYDNGNLKGLDNPDQEIRRVNSVLRNLGLLGKAFSRIFKKNGLEVVLVFVPKTGEFIYIGSEMWARIDNECIKLKVKEAVEHFTDNIISVKGHKWYLSLKRI